MTPIPIEPSSPIKAFKRWGLLCLLVALMTSGVAYGLWQLVILPENDQRFNDHIRKDVENYRQSIGHYLATVEKQGQDIGKTVPLTVVYQPLELQQKWAGEQLLEWKKQLPHIQTITVYKKGDAIVQQQQGINIRFVVIDMINRLESGQPTNVEVAKSLADSTWELHQVVPVNDPVGTLQGVLHLKYSLDGLTQAVNRIADQSIGGLKVFQHIDGQTPLIFYQLGQGDDQFTPLNRHIENSYWQIEFRPSNQLHKQYQVIPLWFWATLAGLAIGLLVIGALFSRPIKDLSHYEQKPVSKASDKTEKKRGHPPVPIAKKKLKDSKSKIENESPVEPKPVVEEQPFPVHVFRAYDVRGFAKTEITPELIYTIAQCLALKVMEAGETAMIVGYDARTHSPELAQCALQGIISTGCNAINIGLVPTPLMNFAACRHEETNSGMIITASHNPAEYNGCKMVVAGQTLVDDDIQILSEEVEAQAFRPIKETGQITEENFLPAYIDYVRQDVAVIDGWRVVVDAGNGAASELAPSLLTALGCEIIPLFCEFDGNFPNHDPDPSVVENLKSLVDTVVSERADFGVAYDGDGDRLMLVTKKGRIVWPDQLLMLFAQDIVARYPGSDVVFDIKSTSLLQSLITEHGGRPVLWKTGHSHIKRKMRETGALLGGEFSGHIFFKERWFGFDDGLYATARLLEILTLSGQSLDELIDELPSRVSTPEIKIAVPEEQKFALINKLANDNNFADGNIITIDGLRVEFEDGWGLVRASNTAPSLTLRFEANDEKTLKDIERKFRKALAVYNLSWNA